MSQFTEILGISNEDALNVAEAYEGYALALSNSENDKDLHLIGSSMLISAMVRTLLDPQVAKYSFSQAASSFYKIQSPLWRICDICSSGSEKNRLLNFKDGSEFIDDEDYFYALLQQYSNSLDTKFHAREADEYYRLEGNIPRLNIPYSLVINVMNDLDQISLEGNQEPIISLSNLLSRFNELTDFYKSDHYRWRNLEGPNLPFEPAALAITVALIKRWSMNYLHLGQLDNLNRITFKHDVLFRIAYQLVNEIS